MAEADTARVLASPNFRRLVHERTRFAWILSGLMLAIYLVFILLIAFAHGLMATKVMGTISLGLVLGIGVILAAFLLTGIYVVRANGRFDDLTRDLNREIGR
ncbi:MULTISPECIES: DUF485 domain-containing protein [Methylobacterium]|uniref:DUF485 domain-containing protein n=1 Tax=Methylobacterium TaxID=407 RepID=UPI0013EA70B1|nr:DUF485 domain-containing protein [Methylobacterium sp. DB0501]NGM34011.1 DUF485 domain-containing protein [Methylobacterium sp. DB0501]